MIRGYRLGARPTGVDDLNEFLGNVNAEPVVPTFIEPLGKLVTGVVVQEIYIEFTML